MEHPKILILKRIFGTKDFKVVEGLNRRSARAGEEKRA